MPHVKKGSKKLRRELLPVIYCLKYDLGGDLASTWVAKPEVHAEVQSSSLNRLQKL